MKSAGFFHKTWWFFEGFGITGTNGSLILISKYLEPGGTLILNFFKPEATGINKINELPDPGIDQCWAVLTIMKNFQFRVLKKVELFRFQFHI